MTRNLYEPLTLARFRAAGFGSELGARLVDVVLTPFAFSKRILHRVDI